MGLKDMSKKKLQINIMNCAFLTNILFLLELFIDAVSIFSVIGQLYSTVL